jgi:HAMP domain-containing protein
MSATERRISAVTTEAPLRVGLKLPPPAPPRFSLRSKIFLAAAVLILSAIGGAVAISTYRARRVADEKIAADLTKAGPAWMSFQQNRYGELHRALGVIVNNPGLIGLIASEPRDSKSIIDTLKTEQASRARADFLLAADRQGVVFARTDKPLGYTADLSAVPTIAGALQGDDTQGIWLSGGRLYHVVGAQVVEGGTRVVGALAAGFQINDDVARNLKSLMNTEVVFLADEAKLSEKPSAVAAASTMTDVSPAVLDAIKRRTGLLDAVLREGKTIGPIPLEISGDTYLGYFLPIRSSTNQLVGAAVALRSRERELAAFRQIQNTQVLVGFAALIVAFGLSFVLARRITVPVDRLLRATEEVRIGNLESADLPVESKDEIGILARSFNAMIEELKEKAALEEYVRSLPFNVGSES